MENQINITGAPRGLHLKRLASDLVAALQEQKFIPRHCRVVLAVSCVGTAEMTRLNFKYRRKRRPTDVLSFEQKAPNPRGIFFLGDLVLCVPVLKAQAKEQGHSMSQEAAVLLAHGILHLLGYDHESSAREERRMARAETRLLKAAGLDLQGSGLIIRESVRHRA